MENADLLLAFFSPSFFLSVPFPSSLSLLLSPTRGRRWSSNPSGKFSSERPTRGTVGGTMRSMCGADAGCLAINYQSLSLQHAWLVFFWADTQHSTLNRLNTQHSTLNTQQAQQAQHSNTQQARSEMESADLRPIPFHRRPYVGASHARSWSPLLVLAAILWAFVAKN